MVSLTRRRANSLNVGNGQTTSLLQEEGEGDLSSVGNELLHSPSKGAKQREEENTTARKLFSRSKKSRSTTKLASSSATNYTSPNSDSAIQEEHSNSTNSIGKYHKFNFLMRRNMPQSPQSQRLTEHYPAAHAIHRVRSAEASNGYDSTLGLSLDPDFFPPNPLHGKYDSINLINKKKPSDANDSGGHVRYGDFVRIWAYSQYVEQGGHIGSLRRTLKGRNAVGKGELFVIPPVTPSPQLVFHEACFKIVDPFAEKEEGDELLYGEQISLVDDRGMVWNNKDGRLHGRLGPSLFGNGGHMHLTLHKRAPKMAELLGLAMSVGSPNRDDESPKVGEHKVLLPPSTISKETVRYGDSFDMVATKVRSKRDEFARSTVTHFRRRHEREIGGFLRSDGKGISVTFQIHHAPPRVTTVMVYSSLSDGTFTNTHTHHKVAWNQEILFDFCPDPPVLPKPGFNMNILGSINRNAANLADLPSHGPKFEETISFGSVCSGIGERDGQHVDSDINIDCSAKGIIRICLSNGGEVLLRHSDILSCQKKPVWFNVQDINGSMCLLARVRALRQQGNETIANIGHDKRKALRLTGILTSIAILKLGMSKLFHMVLLLFCGHWLFSGMVFISLEVLFVWLALKAISKYPIIMSILGPARTSPKLGGSHNSGLPNTVPHAIKLIKCENGLAEDQAPIQTQDDDTSGPKVEVPETFLLAEGGNTEKALIRYLETLKWRQEIKADESLETPHPKFYICKKFYPSCLHGTDKLGSVVYYERLGGIDVEMLKNRGVDSKLLLWHYMFQMENLWRNICPRIEDRSTTVLDMNGVAMKDIGGEVLAFVKASVSMLAAHYPARSNCIFIINVPSWFSYVFRLIRPLLNEETKSKIRPYDSTQFTQALRDWIDLDELPKEYGGNSKYPLFEHPWEIKLQEKVNSVLSKAGMEPEAV